MDGDQSPNRGTADLGQGHRSDGSQSSGGRSIPPLNVPPMSLPYATSSSLLGRPGGAGAAQEALDDSTLISSFNTALSGLYEPHLDSQSRTGRTLSPVATASSIISSLSRNEETTELYPYQTEIGEIEDGGATSHINIDALIDGSVNQKGWVEQNSQNWQNE